MVRSGKIPYFAPHTRIFRPLFLDGVGNVSDTVSSKPSVKFPVQRTIQPIFPLQIPRGVPEVPSLSRRAGDRPWVHRVHRASRHAPGPHREPLHRGRGRGGGGAQCGGRRQALRGRGVCGMACCACTHTQYLSLEQKWMEFRSSIRTRDRHKISSCVWCSRQFHRPGGRSAFVRGVRESFFCQLSEFSSTSSNADRDFVMCSVGRGPQFFFVFALSVTSGESETGRFSMLFPI